MIGGIIQARMGSSRLLGKVMMKLDENNSVLDFVINQVKHCKLVDKIIIATTNLDEDDVIVDCAKKNRVENFRGSSSDVLDRYFQCACKFSISTIIRITSDCPLIDPEIVDDTVSSFQSDNFDYATNKLPLESPTTPQGTEVDVLSFKALKKTWSEAKKTLEREHVTPYIYNNSHVFNILSLQGDPTLSKLRYTIDREKDLEVVRKLVSKIQNRPILTKDIAKLYSQEPSIFEINTGYLRNEGYLKSQKEN